jgi:nucleoside-triphosphatase THEP1
MAKCDLNLYYNIMVNIHISGSPGTGKTTLGIKLKN